MQTCALLLFASAASIVAFAPDGGFGGAGGLAFPGAAAFGPAAFESAFRSYFGQMESLLAAQQAQAQALSSRFWSQWRNSIAEWAPAPFPAQAAAATAASPQYYHYNAPQASLSHSAVRFHPHRLNAASANAVGGDNQESNQVGSELTTGDDGSVYGGSYWNGDGAAGANAGAPAHSSFSAGGGTGGGAGGGLGGAAQGAHASLAVSDRGGFGQAQLFPDPSTSSRISGDIAPLSGGSFGVFSSSSSSSVSDSSGTTHTFKQASVGVNDNGKITTFDVKDP